MNTFFTKRSFILGILLSILVAFVDHYSTDVVHASYMAIDHMPCGAIFIFFVFVLLINSILKLIQRKIKKNIAFSPGELLVVYTMMLVASSVTEMGFGSQILPIISAPTYYSSPQNEWDKLLIPYLKKVLIVTDKEAVKYFYEGLPKGISIPWKVWLLPLLYWIPFILILYFVMICVASILRKQWVEREKLVYPLTILPKEMVEENKGILPGFFKNPLMWFGFSIAFIIGTINAFHFYFPAFPQIQLVRSIPIFRKTLSLIFRISFPVIGFVYFVNLDVAFSLWFFNLIFKVIRGIFNIAGIVSTENVGIYGCAGEAIFAHLGMGAMIMMVGYSLFLWRHHLKDVFSGAIGKKIDDSEEILSYKSAFWGIVFGSLFMILWLIFSGMKWYIAVLFLIFAFLIWLTLTRIVCEGGIPTMVATTIASVQIISMFGSKNLTPFTILALGLTYIYAADLRTFPLASTSMSLKIVEKSEHNRRPFFWFLFLAIFVNIITTIILQLKLAYKYGGINLNNWYFVGGPQAPYKYAADIIKNPTLPNKIGWISRGIGFVSMGILIFARQNFLWWPLHPIGFLIGPVWLMDQLWFSIFVVWLIKKLILKYGGAQIYNKFKYFFLGLPLGLYTCAGIWFIIDLFTGKQGNSIFWI
ncbi:MAG: hypothetical protein NC921_00250 [Candidatus Omnitrophica bacterium]|nr:hypothetical protein [Candidatus Omnitrophota bacterium]MCM8808884.1 hypothetical protein [Candidatus Omnitrophota bacterium]MCM8810497.1 hypothetical protein [Candidatus Omnitrophota bacterium]